MVVASTLKLAKQIAHQTSSNILTPTRAAKLLGTGAAGGKRRTTTLLRGRLQKVRKYATKMWSLRKAGANTQLMTRTAATPAWGGAAGRAHATERARRYQKIK